MIQQSYNVLTSNHNNLPEFLEPKIWQLASLGYCADNFSNYTNNELAHTDHPLSEVPRGELNSPRGYCQVV